MALVVSLKIFAALWSLSHAVVIDVERDARGKPGLFLEFPHDSLDNDKLITETKGLLKTQQKSLYDDVDEDFFESCNERNQKVYDMRFRQEARLKLEPPPILIVCVEPSANCPNGLSLCRHVDSNCSDKYYIFNKHPGSMHMEATLHAIAKKRNVTRHSIPIAEPFSCYWITNGPGLTNAFVFERVIAHGDPECRMTLTVIDPENYDEEGIICGKRKAICRDSDWQINPPKSDLSAYSIDDIMNSQDRLLNGKLSMYDGDGNLFINAGYEHGTIPPRTFWIPFPLQSASAFLNIAVCVRAQSKCSKGVTLTVGECNMTMPPQSFQEPIESQCWSSTWMVKNVALEEGLFIELEGNCRMNIVIWSDDIKKCILDWKTLTELHSYHDSEDSNDHPITITYTQGTILRTGTSKHQQIDDNREAQWHAKINSMDETGIGQQDWNATDTVAFSKEHGFPLKIGEKVYNSTTFVPGSLPNPDDKTRSKSPEFMDLVKLLQGRDSRLESEDFYYEHWGMIDDQKQEVYDKTKAINKSGSSHTFGVNDSSSWSATTNEAIETWINIFPNNHYLLEQLHIECEDVEWRSPLTRITVTHSNGRVEQFDNANNSDPRFLYGTCKPGTGECLNNSTDNSTGLPNNAESLWSSAKLYWSLAAALIGFKRMQINLPEKDI